MERNVIQPLRDAAARLPAVLARAPTVLLPGAGTDQWELLRLTPAQALTRAQATRREFASLNEAALQITPGEPFVLELPTDLGLVQRFVLPRAERAELEEMARIQIEKIMPYAPEAVGFALEEVSRSETEVVVAVQVVHHDRLMILGEPLAARGCWPTRVTLRVSALPAAVARTEALTAFLYAEDGKSILGISEAGHLTYAQALSCTTPEELASELPAVLLGAQLDGIPTHFNILRLDHRREAWGETLATTLDTPVHLFDPVAEAIAATGSHLGDLAPPGWRAQRQQVTRLAKIKRRFLVLAGAYLAILLLGLLTIGALKLRLSYLQARVHALRPRAEAVRTAELHWKTLMPVVSPQQYVVETLLQVYECLPPGDTVRLTSFDATLEGISVQGEAPSATAAAEFTETLKARPELHRFHFRADPPAILPNDRVRFRVVGTS